MKIKTSELTGSALDWAVAKCEGLNPKIVKLSGGGNTVVYDSNQTMSFLHWSQGGPIIEREGFTIEPFKGRSNKWGCFDFEIGNVNYGETPLIAAMRCYVASKLGDEVEVPDELVK